MFKTLIKIFSGLLVLVLIVDPGDLIFHLKIPLFLLIFGLWLFLKLYTPIKINKDILIISFLFLIIPIIGIIIAILQDNLDDQIFAIGFLKSFSVIILLLVVFDLSVPFDRYLVRYSITIPLIIIPIYIFLTVYPTSAFNIIKYLGDKDVAKFANRDFYGYHVLMLYYRTSPLLLFPLAYYCSVFSSSKNKFISIILISLFLFTLILSGTRANMLAGIVILLYFLFSYLYNKKNKFPFIIGCVLITISIISFLQTLTFSSREESSEIKSGHVNSYGVLFTDHPHYLLWGQGLGAVFYSSGNAAYVPQTELTYIDIVRWFGIPIALLLFFLLLYPVIYLVWNKKINNKNKYFVVAYFGYLFIAGTNPLLVSSTGMLAIIVMYSLINTKVIDKIDAYKLNLNKN